MKSHYININCNVGTITDLALDHVLCIVAVLRNITASGSVSCLRILSNVILRNLRKA
jgi:hypothetical protein